MGCTLEYGRHFMAQLTRYREQVQRTGNYRYGNDGDFTDLPRCNRQGEGTMDIARGIQRLTYGVCAA